MSKAIDSNIPSVAGVLLVMVCTIIIVGIPHYIQAQSNSILQIATNKNTYKLGETVDITIKNSGRQPLEFSDSILGLTIQNTKTDQKAGLFGSQVMCELKPDESKTVQWNQKDEEGNQVQAGTYDARTSSAAPITANTIFDIK